MINGEILRRLRTIKGIKQASVAKELGITQQAYSKIEKSKNIDEIKINSLLAILEIGKDDYEELKKIFSK
jgi:transcriptional regulator with XRE-family HTH domain